MQQSVAMHAFAFTAGPLQMSMYNTGTCSLMLREKTQLRGNQRKFASSRPRGRKRRISRGADSREVNRSTFQL